MAWNGVGLVLAELRRFEEARTAYARAIQAKPDYAEAHYNLSFTLSNLGDYAGALRETKRALEIDPYYTPQTFQLAIDLELPGGPELCAIAFLVDPAYRPGELLCRFVHIPLHERRRIEAWLGAQPPPRPAARARVG